MIKSSALKIVSYLNENDFTASNGSLDRWKKRYSVVFRSIVGEKLSADVQAINEFKQGEFSLQNASKTSCMS